MASARERAEKRRQQREARAYVWREVFAAVERDTTADPKQVAAEVAVEIQENGERLGFDVNVLLQLLVTLLPLILELFKRDA
jgi:hypothetical protein